MPKTKLTLSAVKNHWQYGKWIYVAIALGVYFLASLLFTSTEYRPPAERKVDIEIVGWLGAIEPVQQIAGSLLPDAQKFDPTLEEISAYNILYSGDPETDTYGAQKYTVMIAAREGAIYMVNKEMMMGLVQQGGALPLDGYIADGTLDVTGLDLSSVTLDEPPESEEDPPTGAKYVYAIPCADLLRFMDEDILFDVSDKYMVIMSYCPNPDTVAYTLQQFRNAMTQPAPKTPAEAPSEAGTQGE